MIKFPDKPEGCFWRVRQYGSRWTDDYFESDLDSILVIELRHREVVSGFLEKSFGPFEWKKPTETEGDVLVWKTEVKFYEPFYTYNLDYLEATIEVSVKKEYDKYIRQITVQKELLGDYE